MDYNNFKNTLEESKRIQERKIELLDEMMRAVKIERGKARKRIQADNWLLNRMRITKDNLKPNDRQEYEWRVRESQRPVVKGLSD